MLFSQSTHLAHGETSRDQRVNLPSMGTRSPLRLRMDPLCDNIPDVIGFQASSNHAVLHQSSEVRRTASQDRFLVGIPACVNPISRHDRLFGHGEGKRSPAGDEQADIIEIGDQPPHLVLDRHEVPPLLPGRHHMLKACFGSNLIHYGRAILSALSRRIRPRHMTDAEGSSWQTMSLCSGLNSVSRSKVYPHAIPNFWSPPALSNCKFRRKITICRESRGRGDRLF
jgi:hypothetical protein